MFPDLTRDDVFRIETRRMWLRWPRAKDAGAILRLAGEREVAEMTARIPHPIESVGIDSFLIEARRANTEGESLIMALALRSAPTALIGVISVEPDPEEGPHLGYWLGRPHWGEGLMSEAAQAMVDAFFGYAGGSVLISDALVSNPTSRRVLEKTGFREVGSRMRNFPARGGNRPVVSFRLDRASWIRRNADAPGFETAR